MYKVYYHRKLMAEFNELWAAQIYQWCCGGAIMFDNGELVMPIGVNHEIEEISLLSYCKS